LIIWHRLIISFRRVMQYSPDLSDPSKRHQSHCLWQTKKKWKYSNSI